MVKQTQTPHEGLRQAFADLHRGQLDAARSAFAVLCGERDVAVDAYRGLASIAWRQGQGASAIDFLRQAIGIDPENFDARSDLGLVLMLSRQTGAAVAEWQCAAQLRPDDADIWHNLGKALGDLRQLGPCREAFERSLMLKPDRVTTLATYARALANCGDDDGAEALWERVIALQPNQADGYKGLADVQFARGHLERALETYRRGAEAVPDSPEMHMGHAQMLEDFGERENSERSFRRALELRPNWAMALEGLLTLVRGRADDLLVAQAQAIVSDPKRPPPDRANVGFGLGKVFDAQGRYDEAFSAWRQANAARRQQVGPYDRQRTVARVDRLIQAFSSDAIARLSGQGSADERPVFVLGMPRSGTSLVEQIIAAHPDARGLGELREMSEIARSMPQRIGTIQRWPEALSAADRSVLQGAAADYLSALVRRARGDAERLVDKAPLNFFHVGLIALIFPRARMIWCRRDPRDVCLSIYGENFALEQGFATDLADLGHFYREYMRLMRHWCHVLPDHMYECVYEDLVASPEHGARALIEAVGLSWNDACLRFHEQNRPVLTPSRWQVRQPMYARAVGRWKSYERWLRPLIEALGDEIE
ncbi:sulfotransferase [Fontimonas sp. SYSU GA230001]|uniref:tetratricopeptide repeat-containing sulfotransferase family protein n=1 Tax=Fontimonas sp. SYSU GA230001 TaxID=3142450 RepID=UPI0032B3BD7E